VLVNAFKAASLGGRRPSTQLCNVHCQHQKVHSHRCVLCGAVQSIGDTWNHINNRRAELGFAALWNTALVWPSAAAVWLLYLQNSTAAALVILPMNIWLTIASLLIWSIWEVNDKQPLLPQKGVRSK
jgi:tryptophan-rich sensory protein